MYVVKTEFEHPDYVFETEFSAVTLSRLSSEVAIVVGTGKFESAGTWFSPALAREIAAQLVKLADEVEGKNATD